MQALRYGLPEVAALLAPPDGPADDGDLLVAACAQGDVATARRILDRRPDLPSALSAPQLRMLPELAAAGVASAVRLMADIGWPLDTRGGDWDASALNQAVFRGDAAMARDLLDHGARWTETHGFGDNVCGTLSWASCNRPVETGDWTACAEALRAHGLPPGRLDPAHPEHIIIAGKSRRFPDDLHDCLLAP